MNVNFDEGTGIVTSTMKIGQHHDHAAVAVALLDAMKPYALCVEEKGMSVACDWVSPFADSAQVAEPAPWIKYAEQRPTMAGAYRWRLESVVEPGMFVTFVAHMRERGAGYQNVLSPLFDYWDGYSVHVPAAQWQALRPEDPQDVEWCRVAGVEVEGLYPLPCPYCNKVPKWDALLRYDGGGVNLTEPYRFNNWKLACCAWGSSPVYKSPIELVKRRDAVLSRLRPDPVVTP